MSKVETAIIGLGFHVGEFNSAEDFMKGLVLSKKAFRSGSSSGGSYVFDRDVLVESVITEALTDSSISESEKTKAAFIWLSASSGQEKLFSVGGEAEKIAAHFGFEGLSYTIYDGQNSIFRGLALAGHIIAEKPASVVVICAAPPPDGQSKVSGNAEGAVALILKDKGRALSERNKIYAALSALTIIDARDDGSKPTPDDIAGELKSALVAAGVCNGELRAVEIPGTENAGFRKEIDAICGEELAGYLVKENFLMSDTESFLGGSLAITTAAAFVKHALQLFFYHVFMFESESGDGVSFFVDKDPALWNVHEGRRTTVVAAASDDAASGGYIGFAVLTDCVDTVEEDQKCRTKDGLLPLAVNSPKELSSKLLSLQEETAEKSLGGDSESEILKALCHEAWKTYMAVENPRYTAVLMFDTIQALSEEIKLLLAKKEEFTKRDKFEPDFRYTSKRGSYFTAQPHGKDAKVVYMNPPGSAQHMLLFYEMLMLFPRYRNIYAEVTNGKFAAMMNEMDYRFGRFSMELLMIGIVDAIAKDRLGLSADILTGASLGEIATIFAYSCMEVDMQSAMTPAVLKLVAAFRNTYVGVPFQLSVKYVKADIEDIRRAVDEIDDVYILVSASPYGAFVSGKPEAMDQFIEKTRFIAWALDLNSAIHTPFVEQFYDEVYQAVIECNNKFRSDLGLEIYSTYYKEPVENTIEEIAKFVAAILIKPCDFYGLLEVLYDRGSRVFVDMSTGGTCLAWAEETFIDRDTLCFSVYPSFADPRGSLLKTYAKLLSNHINLNLDTFLSSFEFTFTQERNPIEYAADNMGVVSDIMPWPEAEHLPMVSPNTVVIENNNALSVAEIEQNRISTYEISAYVHRVVNQTTLEAYRLYLENERRLLDRIAKDSRTSAGTTARLPAKKACIWDYDDIIEITSGSPSKIWGEKYAVLDGFVKRARLPLPPFMFVNRVVAIDAEFGELRPSSIDVEYDITDECIMRLTDSKISVLVPTEASHVAILLLSYIGIDLLFGGASYRILDSASTLHDDFPTKGDTIWSRLEFLEFIQSGSIILAKSRFTNFVDGKPLITTEVLGGFFVEEDLNREGMGLPPMKLPDPEELKGRAPLTRMKPLKEPQVDLKMFYGSDYNVNFYRTRTSQEVEKMYIDPKVRMIDRVISMDFKGGNYGLGCIVAEKDIDENHWAFSVHFKNDPVFPGSLLVEGANHLQMLFALNAGYAVADHKYILSYELERPIKATFRGQVRQMNSVVRFVQHYKEINERPTGVSILSDCDVIWQGNIVARVEDLSTILDEK